MNLKFGFIHLNDWASETQALEVLLSEQQITDRD